MPEPKEREMVRRAVGRWYRDRARSTFERRAAELVRRAPRLGLAMAPAIGVRKLKMRWGSCSPEGRILMNVDVVKLPVTCIDYLLMHELCHVRVPHHGPAFWRRLEACMPDWKRWRDRLAQVEL